MAGTKIVNTPLVLTEPLPCAKLTPDESHTPFVQSATMLTIEQRMQIDTFLEPFQTWTVGSPAEGASWQVTSCFAPRLHGNGDIDFIAPYLPGSHALALITEHPIVTFLIRDKQGQRWLEGSAQTVLVQRSWERAELLSYLRWRIPEAADGLSGAVEVVMFRPIYLRYCDRWSNSWFEVK